MSLSPKTTKALIALLMISVVAFLARAYLQGQSNSSQPPSTTIIAPNTAAPHTSFKVNIPQKALIKNYVTVSVEAPSGTNCKLIYISPSGETRQTDTISDESGLCVWKWKIGESEKRGTGRLIFTIGSISETHFLEILPNF